MVCSTPLLFPLAAAFCVTAQSHCSDKPCNLVELPSSSKLRLLLQKLAASLTAKGLSETSISASDESDYGQSIGTFLQYGNALDVISQINTHSYPGMQQQSMISGLHCAKGLCLIRHVLHWSKVDLS